MAVKIRLRRMGAKKSSLLPHRCSGFPLPQRRPLHRGDGTYDPTKNPSVVNVDLEKANKWIANGAQPTDTVKKILKLSEEK